MGHHHGRKLGHRWRSQDLKQGRGVTSGHLPAPLAGHHSKVTEASRALATCTWNPAPGGLDRGLRHTRGRAEVGGVGAQGLASTRAGSPLPASPPPTASRSLALGQGSGLCARSRRGRGSPGLGGLAGKLFRLPGMACPARGCPARPVLCAVWCVPAPASTGLSTRGSKAAARTAAQPPRRQAILLSAARPSLASEGATAYRPLVLATAAGHPPPQCHGGPGWPQRKLSCGGQGAGVGVAKQGAQAGRL